MTSMSKAARLADVAKAAGVSQGTASNVFSRPDLVREEVRERVHAAARAIGYGGPDPKGRLLRAGNSGHHVVGVERGWPGKVLADPDRDASTGSRRFAALATEQQRLYAPYAIADAEARGRTMTIEEHFESQPISQRTTYDAVTHALLHSPLTDEQGTSLCLTEEPVMLAQKRGQHDPEVRGDPCIVCCQIELELLRARV